MKQHCDWQHTAIFMKVSDYVNLCLHHSYILSVIKKNSKLSQQFISLFKILQCVSCLAYKLNILFTWCIYPVFTIIMLESAPLPDLDSFYRSRPNHPELIEVNSEPEWEIECMLNKCIIQKGCDFSMQYLIQWLRYESKYNQWYSTKNLLNVTELIEKYKKVIRDRER